MFLGRFMTKNFLTIRNAPYAAPGDPPAAAP
jgi:hypothetical protein